MCGKGSFLAALFSSSRFLCCDEKDKTRLSRVGEMLNLVDESTGTRKPGAPSCPGLSVSVNTADFMHCVCGGGVGGGELESFI